MSFLIQVLLLHLLSSHSLPAQKYWIEFRDKGISKKHFTPGNPAFEAARASLSQKCLYRRSQAMCKPEIKCISIADAPINKSYINALRKLGVQIEGQSKWCNAVSARLTDSEIKRISKLRFVQCISPVGVAKFLSTEPAVKANRIFHPSSFIPHPSSLNTLDTADTTAYNQIIYHYGGSQSQLDRINVWPLHAMGFDGTGVLFGFLDDGMRWKTTSCIEHCNVISEYDYILGDSNVWNQPGDSSNQDAHGTTTLGTAMGYLPDTLIGPAFNASVMLAETEVAPTERNIEEDNYANALEYMEARGVEITSSSLGYFTFDSGQHSYTYADMNGHTAICTQAVERAVKFGILVVTAMGNGNGSSYIHVNAPADADSILACGALDVNDTIASFSSLGPTYDGRIKPDICAPGVAVWVENTDGSFSFNNGTSYATPLTSSACCLIKQAHPEATAQEIRHAVMVTGNNAANPDTVYGWGELNAYAAALELGDIVHPMKTSVDTSVHIIAGIASKNVITGVSLIYAGDTLFKSSQQAQFKLAADSLIYSCTIGAGQSFFDQFDGHIYYQILVTEGSKSRVYPLTGWNTIVVPPPSSVQVADGTSTQIVVNPNPCSSHFDLTSSAPGEWQLFDAIGNKVMSGNILVPGSTQVATSQLPNGSYFVKFTPSTGETKMLPIIIAH